MVWPFSDTKNSIPTFTVENTIATSSRVRGDLSGPGGFRVDGAVEGSVLADGPVLVGEGGVVDGNIRGRDVTILGRVRGDVQAAGHLEIGPKGKVLGDITVQSFRVHTGGVFRGMSCMGADDSVPALGPFTVVRETPRGRTLPPPNGAVPPPPMLSEEVIATASVIPDALASEERLITSARDDVSDARARATGS